MVQKKSSIELEIILVLLRKNTHLREVSRILKKPHSTILRKINELIKDSILDYTLEGKNKVLFIKNNLKSRNLIYSAELYKLNKFLRKYPELMIIFEDLLNKVNKEMVILFGSYAKGNAKTESDIDIYVETNSNILKKELKQINSKLSIKTGEFNKNSLLIQEIIKDHIIINGLERYYERVDFFKKT